MDENKNKIYKLVGAKVLYYRTLEGLTQEELANKIHINVSTLSRIERGKYNQGVSLAMLFDIAEGLNIEVNLLVTFNDDEKKLIYARYYDGYTQSELSRELGMSQVQISRKESKILQKLKVNL